MAKKVIETLVTPTVAPTVPSAPTEQQLIQTKVKELFKLVSEKEKLESRLAEIVTVLKEYGLDKGDNTKTTKTDKGEKVERLELTEANVISFVTGGHKTASEFKRSFSGTPANILAFVESLVTTKKLSKLTGQGPAKNGTAYSRHVK